MTRSTAVMTVVPDQADAPRGDARHEHVEIRVGAVAHVVDHGYLRAQKIEVAVELAVDEDAHRACALSARRRPGERRVLRGGWRGGWRGDGQDEKEPCTAG